MRPAITRVNEAISVDCVARPEGLEPPACWFEANRSIRLSYGRARVTNTIRSYHAGAQNERGFAPCPGRATIGVSAMPVETEIKLPVSGLETARAAILSLGYRVHHE